MAKNADIIYSNKTHQGYLQLRWYTRQQEVANKNDEIVMINASVCIPANQSLGKYVSNDQLTIMVNYN